MEGCVMTRVRKGTRKKQPSNAGQLRKTKKRLAAGQDYRDKLSIKQIEDALRACDGLRTPTAKRLKISYQTLKNYLLKYPELEDVIEEADEDMVDLSESKLKKHIKAGSLDAVKYHLDRKGKKRGYVRQQEIAGVVDKPLSISIVPATGPKDEEED
jgi:hypothetical protein